MDRKWLLGLGGAAVVVLILAIVVVFGGAGGGGPDGAARAFFAEIPAGGPQAAYVKASPAFRNSTSPDAWAATAAQYNLAQYANSTWTESGKGGDVVTLNGELTLRGGGVQPATVQMVKGADGWSVYALNLPTGGVNGGAATTQASVAGPADVNGAAAPLAPSSTTPYPAGPVQSSQAAPASTGGYADAPRGGSPASYSPAVGQGAPAVTLIAARIAHDCGPHLLQLPGVQSIDVHCAQGMAAIPGTRGRCEAMINGGRPVNVSVVVSSYDPVRDDAELDCRLY